MDAPNETAAPPAEAVKETGSKQPDFTRFHEASPVIDTSLDNLLGNEDKAAKAGKPAPAQEAKPADAQAKPEGEKPAEIDYKAEYEKLTAERETERQRLERLDKFAPAIDRLEKDGYDSGQTFLDKLQANEATQAQEAAIEKKIAPFRAQLQQQIDNGEKSLEQAQAELNASDRNLRWEMGVLTREQALDAREQAAQQEASDQALYEAVMADDTTKGSQEAQNLAFWIATSPDFGGPQNLAKAVSEMIGKIHAARDAKRDPDIKSAAIAEYLAKERGVRRVPVAAGGGNPPPFGAGSNDFMHISLDEAMARQGASRS